MKWFSLGLLTFLCLLLTGIGSASLVKSPRRSLVPYYEIQPQQYVLEAEGDNSDLGFTDFERIPDVSYGPFGYRNTMDLYLPQNGGNRMPVILYIHGSHGDKGKSPVSTAYQLLERGYAVVQITYRHESISENSVYRSEKNKEYDFPAQIEDCKAAVRFIRAHAEKYGLDPNRIGAMGHSMGGYLSSLLCTTSDLDIFDNGVNSGYSSAIQAACSWNGPTDLRTFAHETDYHAACFSNQWAFTSMDCFSVGYVKGSLKIAEKASATTYVSGDDPPLLLIAGFNDTVVPPHQANSLYIQLKNAGGTSEIFIVPAGDHDGPTIFNPQTRTRAADFFDKYLTQYIESQQR